MSNTITNLQPPKVDEPRPRKKRGRVALLGVFAVAAAVSMTACSSAGGVAEQPESTQQTLDAAYLSVVRDITPNLNDTQRVAVRDVVCKHLRAEPTMTGWTKEIKPIMTEVHVDAYGAGSILGASIGSACQELKDIAPKV